MIEILILYTIHKREKTIYSIQKEISDIFGFFTKPSIGTVHPALKRLLNAKAVSLTERMSEGGKKSSYYFITKKGYDYFKECFFNTSRDNPSLFYTQLLARLSTMGLLNIEERKQFLIDASKRVELFQIEVEKILNDPYTELDYFQSEVMKKTLNEYKSLKDYLKKLKVD